MKEKTFLFLRQNLNYGGASKIMIWLYNCLRRHEIDAYILTLEENRASYIINDSERVLSLRFRSSGNYFQRNIINFFRKYKKISSVVKEKGVTDIVNFGDSMFDFLLVYKLFHRVNLITSERVDPYFNRNFVSRVRRSFFVFSDKIVFQTEGARNYYSKSIRSKSIIIPNPVVIDGAVPTWEGIESNDIVYIGRLDNFQKRLDVLIDAFEIIHPYFELYKLNIYGDGPDKCWLEEYIRNKDLQKFVIMRGVTNNTLDILSKSKMLILTSDFEGIPNILIEAMQVGIPIVSTDCSPGGARLLIQNTENGFLVERGNPKAISECVKILLEDKSCQQSFSQKSRKSLFRFSEPVIEKTWLTYLMT